MSDWSSDEEWALIAQDVEPSDVQEQNNEQTEVQGQDDQPRYLQTQNVALSDVQQEQNVELSDMQEQNVEPSDMQELNGESSDIQQEQNVDQSDVQQEQNEKIGINRKQKRRQRNFVKSMQHKKSKISRRVDEFSSSDDNIPLMHLQQHKQIDSEVESIYESGDSFKPSKEDYNSSDSNLSSPSDISANSLDNLDIDKRIRKTKRKKKEVTKDMKKNPVVVKHPTENMNTSKTCTPIAKGRIDSQTVRKSTQPIEDTAIYTAKQISVQEATFNEIVKAHHEKRLDDVLFMNGYERTYVAPDGNCFFQSVLPHISKIVRSSDIRQILCNHIIDHATEYVGFFSVSDMSESFDEDISWIDFRQEIDKLAVNGNWTSRAADLLPLALANWSEKNVRIFSSLSHQPILDIKPTLCQALSNDPITLAYLASDNLTIPEHYDICYKIGKKPILNYEIDQESTSQQNTTTEDHAVIENHPTVTQKEIRDAQVDDNSFVNETYTQDDSFNGDKILEDCSGQPHTPVKPKRKKGRPKGTPPKKAPNFITPPKKSLFRKRKATPDSWKKNIRKKLRLSGKEYVSVKGTVVKEKTLKFVDCSKCTFKCNVNIDEEQRQQFFQTFWTLDTNDRKKDFIIANTKEKKTRTYLNEENEPVRKKKNVHRSYSFNVGGNPVKVCKKFFLATLGISETFANHAFKNKQGGVYVGEDRRGKHAPHNKTTKTALDWVRKHIESFPVVDGHYTRKDSSRKYLGADLNIMRMYQLYVEQCKGKIPEKEVVSHAVYRKLFNEEYNFSFHLPKKDQCALCINYYRNKDQDTLTMEMKDEYEKHQSRKIKAREEKKKDKEMARSSPELFVGTFDLQAVLQTPCSLVSQLYYMRKLNCYNLSIYNLATTHATCYLWSEVDAQRGSCEIGTCLYLQLMSLPNTKTHAIFYSDACSGQNRNQFIASCLLHVVINHQSIKVIDHKFLESGHTQMECDSMHSAIEFAKRKTEIFVPQQWATVVQMARRKDPYLIVPLKYGDIYDFKDLAKTSMKFRKEDTKGGKINWLQIRWLRYMKEKPDCLLFKYKFEDEFREMKVSMSNKRGRPSEPYQLVKKYTSRQAISAAKKKDLVGLCKSGIIPCEYHEYYKSLPANNSVIDTLADTDVEEEKVDSDQD